MHLIYLINMHERLVLHRQKGTLHSAKKQVMLAWANFESEGNER